MRTWRLVIFGHEIARTETIEDPDKTLVEAVREMIEDADEELEDGENFIAAGRVADEMEHLVFSAEEEDQG